jgi:hypothetical protein
MDDYQALIAGFTRQYWEQRSQELELALGLRELPLLNDTQLASTPLAHKLALIASAAAGTCERADSDYVSDSCQAVLEYLFAAPGMGAAYTIPAEFWLTDMGQMVALAFIWLERDQLITITEAARLSGKSISTISSRVQRGTLRSYPNPHAINPQRGGRLVRRSDAVALLRE